MSFGVTGTSSGENLSSWEAIGHHAAAVDDLRSLIFRFMTCPEYLLTNGFSAPALVPLDAPTMRVDLDAAPSQLSALRDRIGKVWVHLGEACPHYSVLTLKNLFPDNIDQESLDHFWKSGDVEAEVIQTILNRHHFADAGSKTCVEYGCGLGRVTSALAALFAQVHGYDISTTHLELAEKHIQHIGLSNVRFHLCVDDVLSKPLEKCDFFYSRYVFQHNPPPLMRELITAAFRSLLPGGVGIFQIPTYGLDYSFSIGDYLAAEQPLDMEMHCMPQEQVFSIASEEGCEVLEVREDESVGLPGRWISNTFVVRRSG